MRVFGISEQLAKSDTPGSPLGRYLHWKVISPAQADAGYDFAMTMRDYLAEIGAQKATQGRAGYLPSLRSSSEEDKPARHHTKARAYMEALREVDALEMTAPSATSIVWDVCISENDRDSERDLGLLRSGLNAISRVLHKGIFAHRTRAA
jgi:hypothetical protein